MSRRIQNHPVLGKKEGKEVTFSFDGKQLKGLKGEMVATALYANDIRVFGHHHRDGGPQGIFCANGQCSQCMVMINGKPVKSCMVPLEAGMCVNPMDSLPSLTDDTMPSGTPEPEIFECEVLIIGAGPAGLNAAAELGSFGVHCIICDDKNEAGGKLSLQTHNFFGSVKDCYAGTRGIDIGHILTENLAEYESVELWLNSTVVAAYWDRTFGVSTGGEFKIIKPSSVLIATGARERTLVFPGCDLPGVYGAGAFQTLVNRDQIKSSDRLFIIGGGNVGLIAGYHALQAGIDVTGLVEALDHCGGYKVHEDKIRRLGIPVWTSHTVVKVAGAGKVEEITIAAIDKDFKIIEGTEKTFAVDTVLVAVGLSPVNELQFKAMEYGVKTYSAGDAEEIAEASAAIFSGKITGRKIAQDLGYEIEIPERWETLSGILKSRPGKTWRERPQSFGINAGFNEYGRKIFEMNPSSGDAFYTRFSDDFGLNLNQDDSKYSLEEIMKRSELLSTRSEVELPVHPVIHCVQEIPCNPCTTACPLDSIRIHGSIMGLPEFSGKCFGCAKCVLACPGLAITLVDTTYDRERIFAAVILPYEFLDNNPGDKDGYLPVTDLEGDIIGKGMVLSVRDEYRGDRRKLITLKVPWDIRNKVAGFRLRPAEDQLIEPVYEPEDDPIVCLCERVRKSEIVAQIRAGVMDMNQLKATIRTGMGACGGKTCTDQILRIYREEGVDISKVTRPTLRPFIAEVHLGDFLTAKGEENE
ncbi:MAG: FAD-dependent oxidoreductase [Deltaproteobacteria bacterium]|nr:FAD-dependent oxidoreductase [Deltaproteobacteria bacterium]